VQACIGRMNEGIFDNIDINIIKNHYHVMIISSLNLQSSLLNNNYIIYHHECKGFVVSLDHCNEWNTLSHMTNSQTHTQQQRESGGEHTKVNPKIIGKSCV
jgi:hypothetical protein